MLLSFTQTPLFSLGSVVITATANEYLDSSEVQVAIRHHLDGDWGELDAEDRIYMIRETKSTLDDTKLRPTELAKIRSAKRHFAAIGVEGSHTLEGFDRSVPERWNL